VPDNMQIEKSPAAMHWDRARLNVILPIGAIVAIAIVCIVVAVISSARRADEVSVSTERDLLMVAIKNHSERVLRELDSVARWDSFVHKDTPEFDLTEVEHTISYGLRTYFSHDVVTVIDRDDKFHQETGQALQPDQLGRLREELQPVVEYMRGRSDEPPATPVRVIDGKLQEQLGYGRQIAMVERILDRAAIVAATTLAPAGNSDPAARLIVISVKYIDYRVLHELGVRLNLHDLRRLGTSEPRPHEATFTLRDNHDQAIDSYVWLPRPLGNDVLSGILPFITVALFSFLCLVAIVLQFMKRTALALARGEEKLRHLALHDPLCGLPNRIYFNDTLVKVITSVSDGARNAALFYIDLDHFKDVNDTLGHPIGDELLRSVTTRLNKALRRKDIVARLGGDEFAVITHAGDDDITPLAIANRIIASLCTPYSINGQNIVIGASIGIALIDKESGSAADLMRYADLALYRAKNEGRNRACVYDAGMDQNLTIRKNLESDLRHAIEEHELSLAYQIVVAGNGETVLGVEALARWTHPQWGEISPAEFIPIAENSGLIVGLGEWALRRACLDGKTWPNITVAVNVSPLQFRRTDFVDMVERVLKETEFDPKRLELEVTESTFLSNVDTALDAMQRLKALGVRLALDDFGTGYSSLLYLRRFPFDKLKIDRSFIRSIDKGSDAAIVHAVVSLGRGLGMKVTAEGVETAEQHLFLRAAGVHMMQGFRFGRPVSALSISARLAIAEPRLKAVVGGRIRPGLEDRSAV
jgi:diguanylate cyclase (GGDEF)-like protein